MIPPRRRYGLIGDITQSIIENAIRIVEKNNPNALRKGEGGRAGTGLSRGRGEGGGIAFRGIRRRGEGAAREVVRDFTGDDVRLMDEAILSVSARFDFFGVSDDISSSESVTRSSQSSFFDRALDLVILLGPAFGVRGSELLCPDIQ